MNFAKHSDDPIVIPGMPRFGFQRQVNLRGFNGLSFHGPFDVHIVDGQRRGVFLTANHLDDFTSITQYVDDSRKHTRLFTRLGPEHKREFPAHYFKSAFRHPPFALAEKFDALCGFVRPEMSTRRRIAIGVSMPYINDLVISRGATVTVTHSRNVPLKVLMHGYSTLKLKGAAPSMQINIQGINDVDARDFLADETEVLCDRGGRIRMSAEGVVKAKVFRGGVVYLRGDKAELVDPIIGRHATLKRVTDWSDYCGPWFAPPIIVP